MHIPSLKKINLKHFLLIIIATTFTFSGCTSKESRSKQSEISNADVKKVDTAHKSKALFKYESVSFDLNLIFGGKEAFKGRVYTMTNSSAIRLDYSSGKKLLIHNGDIYTYADPVPTKKMSDRFALFTWQYFFMAPYKLGDQGTNWNERESITIDGQEYKSLMLTFDNGTGDAPDDWYILHPNPVTHLIEHMGYIVTGGRTSAADAEANAHAITYAEYKNIEGIPFAHRWIISDYTKDVGIEKQIGSATISNIKLEKAGDTFDPKKDFLYLKYD